MARIGERLRGHMIVIGYGVTGEAAVNELQRGGHTGIVVLDPSPERIACAVDQGTTALEGDATRDAVLRAARVQTAAGVLLCVGKDDTTALIALSVQRLAPGVRIAALVRSVENERLIRQAGADVIVNAVDLGGHLLARAATGDVPEAIRDLVTNEGEMCLCERPAGPDDIGRPLGSTRDVLGVALRREGRRIGFWDAEAREIRAGDILVEIRPTIET
jgi:voltage-gated potassium channel